MIECGSDAAPLVLGALPEHEARAFARHLESCAVCRDEVAALAPVVDALALSAPRYEVSDAFRRRVLGAVRAEPKAPGARLRQRRAAWTLPLPAVRQRADMRWRPALAGAVVSAVAVIAVVAGIALSGTAPSGPATPRARVIAASVGSAWLRISGDRGELIIDHLPPAPPDRVYELWLQRGARTPAPSTLFAVTSRDTAVVGVPADLTGITRVLVTSEPAGGSAVPTSPPAIVAPVT